jgi:peptide deformylase
MLPILREPNILLRKVSSPVTAAELASGDMQTFLHELTETMKHADGVGIAAPQVGVSKRVMVVQTSNGPDVFINPKIVSSSLR